MREINIKPRSILLEPFGRNTAPAVTLAAIKSLEFENAKNFKGTSQKQPFDGNAKKCYSKAFVEDYASLKVKVKKIKEEKTTAPKNNIQSSCVDFTKKATNIICC